MRSCIPPPFPPVYPSHPSILYQLSGPHCSRDVLGLSQDLLPGPPPRNTWPRRHPGGTLVRCPRHLLPFDVDWFSLRSFHMTELHLICVTARVNRDVSAPDNCCLLLNNKTNKLNLLCWNANRFLLLIWQQSKQRHTDSSSLSPWCQYSNDLYWLKWMEVSFPDFKAVLPHEIHSLASPLQLFEVKDAR